MQGDTKLTQQQRFQYLVADELVRKAQAGEMLAHSEIYRTYSQAVMTLAMGICRNTHAAEDVVANTFIRLIDRISSFEFRAPFGMWLRQIAVNESLTYLRKQKKHASISTDEYNFFDVHDSQHDQSSATMGFSGSSIDFTEDHCTKHELSEVLSHLPENVRVILWLKEIEGYTHNEIAEMVNKTPSYSKSVVARGYKFLRDRIGVANLPNSQVIN